MPIASPDSYSFTPGVTLYAGQATPGGSLLTTLTLVNTSGSEQSANFVSPMFGQPFKQGDVPSGEYPKWELTDGTPCPATVWGVTTWPDGSMKFCAAMIRVPTTIAGSGSLTINVLNGGSEPSASSRATSDLTAADLKTELTGVTNLSGVWTASLNTAITDADDIVVIGDGAAGKVWRIGGPFKQSGSPHGQLHCWHYVAALQNSSGGLLGLRYLGRAALPWCDVTSPTATSLVLTAELKSGASTLRSLQGYTSSGGSLGANIRLPHYASLTTAGPQARWDYVQGGGSASADCTVRVQHDMTYARESKLTPPVRLDLSLSDSAEISYYAGGPAGMTMDMGTGGSRPDIAPLPAWAVRHMNLQTVNTERQVRAAAMAASGWRFCVRKSTTNEPVPVADIQASYPGLGTIQTTWRKLGGNSNISGFVAPTSNTSSWAEDTGHMPAAVFPAYLFTGEPQYYDMLIEQAFARVHEPFTGTSVERVDRPLTRAGGYTSSGFQGERTTQIGVGGAIYKGSGPIFVSGGLRIAGWASRDVALGAAMAVSPHAAYLQDVAQGIFDAATAYVAAQPESYRNAGFFWRRQNNGSHEAPWMSNYLCMAACYAADVTGLSGAASFRSHLAKFHEAWIDAGSSPALLATFRYAQWTDTAICDTLQDCVMDMGSGATLTFTSSDNRVVASNPAWTPTNGDAVMYSTDPYPSGGAFPVAGAANDKRYYVVNASGGTFQISETPGGSPLTFTGDATVTGYFANAKTIAGTSSVGTTNYAAILSGTVRWFKASGEPVDSALAASDSLNTDKAVDFTDNTDLALAMVTAR